MPSVELRPAWNALRNGKRVGFGEVTTTILPPILNMKIIDPQALSASEFYTYMVEAVVPRPIAFASTVDQAGRVNLSPYSFFNAFSASSTRASVCPCQSNAG